jgi:hypothetical protein
MHSKDSLDVKERNTGIWLDAGCGANFISMRRKIMPALALGLTRYSPLKVKLRFGRTGCVVAQTVSPRHTTAAGRVRARIKSCGICGG